MKKFIIALTMLVCLSGCVSPVVKSSVTRNAQRLDSFTSLMDKDITTRDQERAFIRANRIAWHSLNYYLNDAELPSDVPVPGDE